MASVNSTSRIRLYGATCATCPFDELRGGHRSARHDEGLGHLARLRVWAADHGHVGHGRMSNQQRLEFGRGDLVTLVLDEFLDPVGDVVPAVLIDGDNVAGA